MGNVSAKCVILLSSKSSGSSAVQRLLARDPRINHVSKTRHAQNETLYWTKAASILELPQVRIADSEVPISRGRAREDLINLLSDNLDSYIPPVDDGELIFGGWRLLCERYSPVFLEKSPHHLHQRSALELILKCIEVLPEIDFLLVGLVRDPMDTLYSMWRRWRGIPERNQYEWYSAYSNLLRLAEVKSEGLSILRYEDLVEGNSCLKGVYEFAGVQFDQDCATYFHSNSIGRWKRDGSYGFNLAEEVIALAEQFGYERQSMANENRRFWPVHRGIWRAIYSVSRPMKLLRRNLRRRVIKQAG